MAVDFAELSRLPPKEKLQIITMLWDELSISGLPKLPESEWDEVFRRYEDMQRHPEETLTVAEFWSRVSRQKE